MTLPLIIKLGGTLLDSEEAMERFFLSVKKYRNTNQRPVLIVHGGGYLVDNLMNKLSLPVNKKNGLRITPTNQIDLITGALAGTANKMILAASKKHGIEAVGLCLSDGNIVKVKQLDKNLGHIGKTISNSPKLLTLLLHAGYLPIISSIGITDDGLLMNVNADQAATAIATTLDADLILLSDVCGIIDDNKNRIKEITADQAKKLINNGIISGGMIIKVNSALEAARTLRRPVDIASWQDAEKLPILFNGTPIGTRIIV